MLVPVKDMTGKQVGELELSDAVFAAPINKSMMHQAVVRQLANARLGTHKTKTRGEVAGGGRKPWRQKGTGRARQGSTRAPNFIGGGIIFGPTPRTYTQAMPKKMLRNALRSALSVKAAAGQLLVVDSVSLDVPKTKAVVGMLSALGLAEKKNVLMVMAQKNPVVWKSAGNLPNAKCQISGLINVSDLLGHDSVVLTRDAVEHIESWLGVDLATADSAEVEA